MDGNDAVTPLEIWHRRQVAAYWNVGHSTLDRWVADGHWRLPAPRFDPGDKPYWLASEVHAAAVAPEPGAEPAPAPAPPEGTTSATASSVADVTEDEALALLRRA